MSTKNNRVGGLVATIGTDSALHSGTPKRQRKPKVKKKPKVFESPEPPSLAKRKKVLKRKKKNG